MEFCLPYFLTQYTALGCIVIICIPRDINKCFIISQGRHAAMFLLSEAERASLNSRNKQQQQQQHLLNGPLSRTIQMYLQEKVSGSGIRWAICKSTPHPRQTTIPASHHSVFLQTGCPSCRPTNSVKALKAEQQKMNESGHQPTFVLNRANTFIHAALILTVHLMQ